MAKRKADEADVGRLVRRYAGPPGVSDESGRSSFREDTVITKVASLLNSPERKIRIVDACCGLGTLGGYLAKGLGEKAKQVSYFAFDQSSECVGQLRKQIHIREAFSDFDVKLAEIWEPPSSWDKSIDFVVLNNVLHELPAVRFPELFTKLNGLLRPGDGQVCVVDMEALPPAEPESIAINWTRVEVEQFLKAGRLKVVVTSHEKAVGVFCAMIEHTADPVDQRGMLEELGRLLRDKLRAACGDREQLPHGFHEAPEQLIEWVVLTGTIARLAEERLAVEDEIAKLSASPSPPA